MGFSEVWLNYCFFKKKTKQNSFKTKGKKKAGQLFFFSWPELKFFSSRNLGHPIIEHPYHIALNDRKSKAGILYSIY